MTDGQQHRPAGHAVREDLRFLTGKGRYTDDINRPGRPTPYFLRSPHAHAKIKLDRHRGGQGGAGRRRGLHRRRHGGRQDRRPPLRLAVTDKDGCRTRRRRTPPLVRDKVRYVGDQVAVVIAESHAAGHATPPS